MERAAGTKNFAVLLCAEQSVELPESAWTASLPHRSAGEIAELKRHFLGCATWSHLAETLCSGLRLPDDTDEAVDYCLTQRP